MKKISRLILPLILMNGIVGCSSNQIEFISMEVKDVEYYEKEGNIYVGSTVSSIEIKVESIEQYDLNNIVIYHHNIGNDIVYTLDSNKNKCNINIELIDGKYVSEISFGVEHEYKNEKITNYIELKEINFKDDKKDIKVKVTSNNRLDFKCKDDAYNNRNTFDISREDYGSYEYSLDLEKKEVYYEYNINSTKELDLKIEPNDHMYYYMKNGEVKKEKFEPFYAFIFYRDILTLNVEFKEGHKEIGINKMGHSFDSNIEVNVKLPSTLEKLTFNNKDSIESVTYQYNGTMQKFKAIEKVGKWQTNYIKCSDGVVTSTISEAISNFDEYLYFFTGKVDKINSIDGNFYDVTLSDSTGKIDIKVKSSKSISLKDTLVVKLTHSSYYESYYGNVYDIL